MSTLSPELPYTDTAALDHYALRGLAADVAQRWTRQAGGAGRDLAPEAKQQLATQRFAQLVTMGVIEQQDSDALIEYATTGQRPDRLSAPEHFGAAGTTVAGIMASAIAQMTTTQESFLGDLFDTLLDVAEGAALGFIIAGVPGAIFGGAIALQESLS